MRESVRIQDGSISDSHNNRHCRLTSLIRHFKGGVVICPGNRRPNMLLLHLMILVPAMMLGAGYVAFSTSPDFLAAELFATVLTILALLLVLPPLRALVYVKPGERRLFISVLTGECRSLSVGLHWVINPLMTEYAPHTTAWRKFKRFPEVGSRLHVDPIPAQVHTSDGITASADVSLECVVREWSGASLLKDQDGCIHSRACATANQWLTEQISEIRADCCTYGYLNQFLNAPERLDGLNAMLASSFTHLQALRVVLDQNGIVLAESWLRQRDEIHQKRQLLAEKEKVLEKELMLARVEHAKAKEEADFQLEMERRRAEHQIESNKLTVKAEIHAADARAESELVRLKAKQDVEDAREQARMKNMVENGLTMEQYCSIAIAQIHFDTMAQSTGVKYLAVPPHLLGLSPVTMDTSGPSDGGYQHVQVE